MRPILLLLLILTQTSLYLSSDPKEISGQCKTLKVKIGSLPARPVLTGTLTIPCHIKYLHSPEAVTVGRRAVLSTPRLKWSFISNGKEVEILVAQGPKVKISDGYRFRALMPNYADSADDVTLVLNNLLTNDSGIYRCHVQHGIEDDYDMLEVKVKGVVFLYREGTSRYAYTFSMAQEACSRIKASIATPEQLLAAYQSGYEQCDAGWISDQTVRYPIQSPRRGCYGDMDGYPGVRNYGVLDPDDMYDVYCYVEELNGEVFLGSEPKKFTLEEARDYCRKLGTSVASTGQLYAAWNQGLDYCSPGWLSDGSVRFPIVTPREKCGGNSTGVKTIFRFRNQTGFPEPTAKYEVYCFRDKSRLVSQDLDKGRNVPVEQVRDIVTLAEAFKELTLSEVKNENEAQGHVDSIPINKAKGETITEEQESTFPPSMSSSIESSSSLPHLLHSPVGGGLIKEKEDGEAIIKKENALTQKSSVDVNSEFILDGIVDVPTQLITVSSTAELDAESDYFYDNITGLPEEFETEESNASRWQVKSNSQDLPNPTKSPNVKPQVDYVVYRPEPKDEVHTSVSSENLSEVSSTPAQSAHINMLNSYLDDDKELTHSQGSTHNTKLEEASKEDNFSSIRPTAGADDFEASGHKDYLFTDVLNHDHSNPHLNSLKEPVTSNLPVSTQPPLFSVGGTGDPSKDTQIFNTKMVTTTPLSPLSQYKSYNDSKVPLEDGSGEASGSLWVESAGETNNTHVSTNTVIHSQDPTNYNEVTQDTHNLDHSTNTNDTTTVQDSHLNSQGILPVVMKDKGFELRVDGNDLLSTALPSTNENPTSSPSTNENPTASPSTNENPTASPVHNVPLPYTLSPYPDVPEGSTKLNLEKLHPPDMSLSTNDSPPAMPTENAILGAAVNLSDVCYPNPCDNGGTCIEKEEDDFSCLCLPGYSGKNCETYVEKCPNDWDVFQGFCYKHFYTRQSWEEAETNCREIGGHLTSVVTPEEQDYVNSQYREYQWTGLNDRTIEGDFQWSDGNPLLYENWAKKQPDSFFLSGEDCVVMVWHDGGKWSDVPCNYHLPYTCKMALVSCGPPPEVANATMYGRPKLLYQTSSVVGYRCQEGFVQKNLPIIKCQPNGTWEEPQINCIPSE
ncbi:hypothetical protein GDO86_016538 [Hymenochirus boettgeri]|uniref:Brevican core protein n=1 Tax=Hymenochirus boettgeri TaxID=247094 RepID=A0A8T2JXG6_9PIPI|nr:hypothetical protein GDO86_016538 [Hymenochirus boettgeri]